MIKNIKYNREFQFIDTEQKAYFLGYFYGDGCVHQRLVKNSKVYSSSITSLDWDIIYKLKEIFPFFNVLDTKSKYKTLVSSNPELFNDLMFNGVFPKKSTENKNSLKIPKLDKNLIKHFIRGLYDSDGGYYLYGTLLETFFCSTSLPFVLEIQKWFLDKNIRVNLHINNNRKTTIYYLRSKSNKTAIEFYKLIYEDASIFMDRKKEVFIKMNPKKGFLKTSEFFSIKKGTDAQLERLQRDYKNVILEYKNKKIIENPSVCCNYHTVVSGKSYKKNSIRDLYLCLNCGKKSVFNKVLLKQDELLETP